MPELQKLDWRPPSLHNTRLVAGANTMLWWEPVNEHALSHNLAAQTKGSGRWRTQPDNPALYRQQLALTTACARDTSVDSAEPNRDFSVWNAGETGNLVFASASHERFAVLGFDVDTKDIAPVLSARLQLNVLDAQPFAGRTLSAWALPAGLWPAGYGPERPLGLTRHMVALGAEIAGTTTEIPGPGMYEMDLTAHLQALLAAAVFGGNSLNQAGTGATYLEGRTWHFNIALRLSTPGASNPEAAGITLGAYDGAAPALFSMQGSRHRVPGPDQGYSWKDMWDVGRPWAESDSLGAGDARPNALSWSERRFLQPMALHWWQIHADNLSWQEIARLSSTPNDPNPRGYTWYEIDHYRQRGLSWRCLDERYLPWLSQGEAGAPAQKQLTWWDLEHHAQDDATHRGSWLALPEDTREVRLRLSLCDAEGNTSVPLRTYRKPVAQAEPICLNLRRGETALVPLYACGDDRTQLAHFELRYHPKALRLDAVPAEECRSEGSFEVVRRRPGHAIFTCEAPVQQGPCYSGLLGFVQFTALKNGPANVELSRLEFDRNYKYQLIR